MNRQPLNTYGSPPENYNNKNWPDGWTGVYGIPPTEDRRIPNGIRIPPLSYIFSQTTDEEAANAATVDNETIAKEFYEKGVPYTFGGFQHPNYGGPPTNNLYNPVTDLSTGLWTMNKNSSNH